jgi:hypothetical protein
VSQVNPRRVGTPLGRRNTLIQKSRWGKELRSSCRGALLRRYCVWTENQFHTAIMLLGRDQKILRTLALEVCWVLIRRWVRD